MQSLQTVLNQSLNPEKNNSNEPVKPAKIENLIPIDADGVPLQSVFKSPESSIYRNLSLDKVTGTRDTIGVMKTSPVSVWLYAMTCIESFFFTVHTVMKLLNLTHSTAKRHFHSLIDDGLVMPVPRKRKSNGQLGARYYVFFESIGVKEHYLAIWSGQKASGQKCPVASDQKRPVASGQKWPVASDQKWPVAKPPEKRPKPPPTGDLSPVVTFDPHKNNNNIKNNNNRQNLEYTSNLEAKTQPVPSAAVSFFKFVKDGIDRGDIEPLILESIGTHGGDMTRKAILQSNEKSNGSYGGYLRGLIKGDYPITYQDPLPPKKSCDDMPEWMTSEKYKKKCLSPKEQKALIKEYKAKKKKSVPTPTANPENTPVTKEKKKDRIQEKDMEPLKAYARQRILADKNNYFYRYLGTDKEDYYLSVAILDYEKEYFQMSQEN